MLPMQIVTQDSVLVRSQILVGGFFSATNYVPIAKCILGTLARKDSRLTQAGTVSKSNYVPAMGIDASFHASVRSIVLRIRMQRKQ